jgi:predicted acyltransferase
VAADDTLTREETRALRAAERKVASEGRTSPRRGPAGQRRPRGRRRTRLQPLDAARGVLVAVVVLATTAGAGRPSWLVAVDWVGWRTVDLVAPALAVLSGTALALHVAAHARASAWWWVVRTSRRVAVLLAAGALVLVAAPGGWPPAPAAWPWTGPLVRLAIAWVVALVLVRGTVRGVQVGVAVVLLGGHAWLVRTTGALTPAGAGALDAAVLGANRVAPVDPDGLWTLAPAVVALLVGAWIGQWWRARPAGPATGVAALVAAGWVGAGGVLVAQVVRVVPALWTAPVVLLGTATALALLGAAHLADQHALPRRLLRWPVAVGALALPVGVAAAATAPWLAEAPPWQGLRDAVLVPLLGAAGGALAAGALVLAVLARVAVALHGRGVDPRA